MGFPETREVEISFPDAPLPAAGASVDIGALFLNYRKIAFYIRQTLAAPGNQIAVSIGYTFNATIGPPYVALIRDGVTPTSVIPEELTLPVITGPVAYWLVCACNPGGAEGVILSVRETGVIATPSSIEVRNTASS